MSAGETLRRVVIWTVVWLLVVAGGLVAAGSAYVYYHNHRGWYVGLVAALIGVGSALGSWLAAALLGTFVEIANSVYGLARVRTKAGGEG